MSPVVAEQVIIIMLSVRRTGREDKVNRPNCHHLLMLSFPAVLGSLCLIVEYEEVLISEAQSTYSAKLILRD